MDFAFGGPRRVVDRLRTAGGDEFVARTHFLGDARQHHGRGLAAALESRRAEVNRFIRERLIAVGIDQRHAAAIHIPALFRSAADATHVGAVAGREDHAVGLRADDGRRLVEPVGLDNERSREERLDVRVLDHAADVDQLHPHPPGVVDVARTRTPVREAPVRVLVRQQLRHDVVGLLFGLRISRQPPVLRRGHGHHEAAVQHALRGRNGEQAVHHHGRRVEETLFVRDFVGAEQAVGEHAVKWRERTDRFETTQQEVGVAHDLDAQPRTRLEPRQLDVSEQLAHHGLAYLFGRDHRIAPVHGDAVDLELLKVVVDSTHHRGERVLPAARGTERGGHGGGSGRRRSRRQQTA